MNNKFQSKLYTAIVRPVWDGDNVSFEGTLKEFGRTVTSEGSTPAEALGRLYENGDMLIEDAASEGEALPEFEPPREWESYSGKMTVRMPRSLHCKLHILAEEEGVSLNSMAVTLLSWGAERKHCEIRPLATPNQIYSNVLVHMAGPYNEVGALPMSGYRLPGRMIHVDNTAAESVLI